GRWALAALGAIASVQTLYANAPLVGAITLAAIVTALRARSWRRAVPAALAGAVAALSLLPYAGAIRAAADWSPLVRTGLEPGKLWTALTGPAPWDAWIWIAFAVLGIGIAVRSLTARGDEAGTSEERERLLFAGGTLVIGTGGFLAFLVLAQLPTEP